ncbi:hypothetical protein PHAVU_001G196300 [Phaseolus vulgaris]|uniref:t-SNARE coiled-coil homology domain-containing protein n=1 Tax=Phaseolus vulgaris TaxID=3885 RepID=V7CXP9_PHAVU|nr:hypothetical protein PHAVU_001G196300g [Phaseolus vulgaris]ESW34972.1 hypothetical protein PHAVU_001G196300g [Phaseolus vulgaris]
MHDLLSTTSSSRSYQFPPSDHSVIEMAGGDDDDDGAKSLAKYFGNVEAITEELNKVEQLKQSLKRSHEQGKTLHNGKAMKDLRFSMEAEVALALETAKFVRFQLEALERANADHRSLPGRGPGSSSDRSRTSVVISLWKKLKDSLDGFNELRHQINTEHRETVQRQYFTVTGNNPDDSTLDLLISSGESENLLQRAIEEQGRGRIEDIMNEIKERHDEMKELEKNLKELHQVFLDMTVLVESQGEQLDDIENQVARANSFVRNGSQNLEIARKEQKNHRKWGYCAIILLVAIVLFVVLFFVRPWEK